MMSEIKALKISSLLLTALIFILISLGGLVRNEGAGLACPDWPLCFGQVVPPMDKKIFLEWFHRLIASFVSAGLLGITFFIFSKKILRRRFGKYCLLALAFLLAQVVLGGMTVLGLLHPKWVSSHLAVGLAFFGTLLWLSLEISNEATKMAKKSERVTLFSKVPKRAGVFARLSFLATVLVYCQILLGGLVSSNYAGLACPDFPTCFGAWVPPLIGGVRFQFFHRVGALIVTIVLTACLWVGISLWSNLSKRLRVSMRVLPVLLFFQLCLGVGSVYMQLPVLMSVAHLAIAAALFGKMIVLTHEILHLRRSLNYGAH